LQALFEDAPTKINRLSLGDFTHNPPQLLHANPRFSRLAGEELRLEGPRQQPGRSRHPEP